MKSPPLKWRRDGKKRKREVMSARGVAFADEEKTGKRCCDFLLASSVCRKRATTEHYAKMFMCYLN